jgi:DNA-directed RNA polymerase II subunit RPB9
MLYPKEDPHSSTLMYACRTCTFSEPAASACVFRNIMSNTVGETEGVTQDVASDPTVGTPDFCIMCGHVILCDICDEEMVGSGDEYNEEEPAHDSLADVAESDKLPTKN